MNVYPKPSARARPGEPGPRPNEDAKPGEPKCFLATVICKTLTCLIFDSLYLLMLCSCVCSVIVSYIYDLFYRNISN